VLLLHLKKPPSLGKRCCRIHTPPRIWPQECLLPSLRAFLVVAVTVRVGMLPLLLLAPPPSFIFATTVVPPSVVVVARGRPRSQAPTPSLALPAVPPPPPLPPLASPLMVDTLVALFLI
jgi:hypothetical protein